MAPLAKRKRTDQPEEITFDPSARQDYLTGFHKRKQARIQNARETAAKRDKEDKVKGRKQLREQRKEDLQRHVSEFNAELRKQNVVDSSDAESSAAGADVAEQSGEREGIQEAMAEKDIPEDEEYVDEDKYTTVTVEAMDDESDASEQKHGVVKAAAALANGDSAPKTTAKKRIWSKDGQAKTKKKKFRYESKAERQVTRQKQKTKDHKAKLRRTGK